MDSDVAIVTLFNVKFYWILVIHSKQLPIHQFVYIILLNTM